jgi:murein L,D-transpeptidase YafK
MYVYFADTFKVFKISLGANPYGHKTRKGDNKTPEGRYKITFKNPKSRGYKSLKISYPNDADRANANRLGVDPGGDIFIHGLWWTQQDPKQHWKDNWTRGCIAVNNSEIDEIYKYTDVNTEIVITP